MKGHRLEPASGAMASGSQSRARMSSIVQQPGQSISSTVAAERHQAVSGYRYLLATLVHWCRIRSYLDSAVAHRIAALDAIRTAIEGKPCRTWHSGYLDHMI